MRRLASFRGNLLGVATVLATGVLASSAQALPIPLSSVACSSASECIAVGKGQEGTFNPVSPASLTTTPTKIDSGGSLVSVACPPASKYCTAIAGGGQEVTFGSSGTLIASSPAMIDVNEGLRSVACSSEKQCTAVDRYGYEVTFDPISGATVAGSFQRIDSGSLESVECPTEKQCTAVDWNGYEVTFEPSSSAVISLVRLEVGDFLSVACPTESQCTAVDSEGHEATFKPGKPGEPPPTPITIDGATALTGVACPSVSQCTAVDASGHEVTFKPALPGTPTQFAIDGTVALTSIACPTEKQCTAVDAHGHEVTFEPQSQTTNSKSTTIGAGPVPSAAKSSITVTPDPTLLSGLEGSTSWQVTVTLEDEKGEPVPGDLVTLATTGEALINDNPQETDSEGDLEGQATFEVTCPAGYCTPGEQLTLSATDEDGPALGPVTENVGEIQFAGASYAGEPDTLEIEGLGGAETETNEKPVTLAVNGSPVALSVPCDTDSTGSLPLEGELGACTFTVPEIPFPKGQSPPVSIPAVVTVGTREFDVSFPLQPTPSLAISPSSGLERSVISVKGSGFAGDVPVKVDFTPKGAGVPSTSTECQTNGDGEIINTEPIGKPDSCDLKVPADSPVGMGTVSVEGYATANATFTVEPPTLVGVGIASNLAGNVGGSGGHLYLGETATLEIEGHYNTGTIKSLEVPAGDVSWSPEPQPSGAIELNVVNGHTIGLTAKERTKSTGAGVVKVTYQGFEAKSKPIKVTHEPCKGCTFVNGALLNVKAQVPEGLGSKPLAGAIANITQGVGSAPVVTLPPPCIPENGGCSSTYPDLEESATETCTTEAAGECQLIAGEGTEGVATQIDDTITLTAPTGYSVTGVSGCHEVTGPPEAPVCHLELGELSNPTTITFELKPWPVLTVGVGAPEGRSTLGTGDLEWYNEAVDGVVATITPIEGTPGQPVTCEVEGGEHTDVVGGGQAHCTTALVPGTYEVSVGPKLALKYENVYVTNEDPKTVKLGLGANETVSFNTASEYPLVSVASGNSTESSTPAEANDGPLTATASGGTGTVTVGRYESDPVGVPTFYGSGQYIDVFLTQGSTFTSLTFTDCEMGGGKFVFWWNPKADNGNGEWSVVSDETEPSGSPPCVTVTINETTSPTLKQLTGTVFGVGLPFTTSTSTTSSSSSTAPPPAKTAATGKVSLDGTTIKVQSTGKAAVKLTCTGTATCTGKLILTTNTKGKGAKTKGKGKGEKKTKTETIGSTTFSIPAGKTATIELTLGTAGKALLGVAYGHLSATLTILKSSPSPSSTQTESVHLTQQKATKAKGKKK